MQSVGADKDWNGILFVEFVEGLQFSFVDVQTAAGDIGTGHRKLNTTETAACCREKNKIESMKSGIWK